MPIVCKATIEKRLMLGQGGTTKNKGKEVRTISFKKENNLLLMKVNGEPWQACIDTISVLCDLGLKIKIPQ